MAGAPCIFRLHYTATMAINQAVLGTDFVHESGVNVAGPNSGRGGARPVQQGDGYVDSWARTAAATCDLPGQPGHHGPRPHLSHADRDFDVRVRATGEQEAGLTRMPGTSMDPSSSRHRASPRRGRQGGTDLLGGDPVAFVRRALATGAKSLIRRR